MSIPLPTKPKVIKKGKNTAVFQVEALYPGYGFTLGNSLRRVLFSSLEGAAITQIKIKSVSHEFSTIPGVLEDVVMILLNLKKLRFKLFTDEPQIANLSIKGQKEVTASDFKLSAQTELGNSEEHIATLTKSSSSLEIEAQIETGIGYEPAESREDKKGEVSVLLLDAIFTPIIKVGLKVESMRVGKRTDFDRLLIDLETDGTITPEEALARSLKILVDHFSFFSESVALPEEVKKEKKKEPAKKTKAAKTPSKPKVDKKTEKPVAKKKTDTKPEKKK